MSDEQKPGGRNVGLSAGLATNPELLETLRRFAGREMTRDEIFEQHVSWVMGQTGYGREEVEEFLLEHMGANTEVNERGAAASHVERPVGREGRSAERRVGNEGVSRCRSGWWQEDEKK